MSRYRFIEAEKQHHESACSAGCSRSPRRLLPLEGRSGLSSRRCNLVLLGRSGRPTRPQTASTALPVSTPSCKTKARKRAAVASPGSWPHPVSSAAGAAGACVRPSWPRSRRPLPISSNAASERTTQRTLVRRPHLCPHRRGLPLPGFGDRRLQPPGDRLGHRLHMRAELVMDALRMAVANRGGQDARSHLPLRPRRPIRSGAASRTSPARPGCVSPWAEWPIALITPLPSRSSPPSTASFSTSAHGRQRRDKKRNRPLDRGRLQPATPAQLPRHARSCSLRTTEPATVLRSVTLVSVKPGQFQTPTSCININR